MSNREALEANVHPVATEQRASRILKEITGNDEAYCVKISQEKSWLLADEQDIVDALEDFIKLNFRSITGF